MSSKQKGFLLWTLALLMMAGAAVYQRRTGPTYPKRGEITVGGQAYAYRLVRSHETTHDALVVLPDPGVPLAGTLYWRRYPLDEPYTPVELIRESDETGVAQLTAPLPSQPAAGKLEYYVVLRPSRGDIRIPELADETIIIRYKDPVPAGVLIPHIFFMFFAVLIGMRAGWSAILQPETMRRYAWASFASMTVGGMILGPLVQKYAFGKYWTGFPWGFDLTDNKMLIMWLAWLIACTTIGLKPKPHEKLGRVVVVVAALVMTAVYLIPHSMQGSELDYSKLDQGVSPEEAIGTGEN